MRNVHIFSGDNNGKFSYPFIDFMQKHFKEEHLFLIVNRSKQTKNTEKIKTLSINFSSFLLLIKFLYRSNRIFLHNLTFTIVLILFFQPWLLKKCYWIMWGGDLYYYQNKKISLKSTLKERIRKFVIKRMHGLITQLYGDYKLAQKWYGTKAQYYYSFLYPSNLYKDVDLSKINKEQNKFYIQVGNSACSTNEHIESFEKLTKFKDNNIKIICPLSYSGKKEYIDKVIKEGFEIFGEERFLPILDFMPFEDYLDLLGKIDVAIFNHRRQRGLGNITTLLGLGKKVYVREEITTWDFCKDHGLKVYSANNDFEDIFERISAKDKEMNHKIMKEQFSEEKLVADWEDIFLS